MKVKVPGRAGLRKVRDRLCNVRPLKRLSRTCPQGQALTRALRDTACSTIASDEGEWIHRIESLRADLVQSSREFE